MSLELSLEIVPDTFSRDTFSRLTANFMDPAGHSWEVGQRIDFM